MKKPTTKDWNQNAWKGYVKKTRKSVTIAPKKQSTKQRKETAA